MRLNATETGKAEKPTWRKRANKQLTTKFRTPASAATASDANPKRGQGAITEATPIRRPPPAEPIRAADDGDAAGGGQAASGTHPSDATAQIVTQLVALQSQRKFAITEINRSERAIESLIALRIGFRLDDSEKNRKAVFARAKAFRLAVERSGKGQQGFDTQVENALSAIIPLIVTPHEARKRLEKLRKDIENEMEALAKQLPVAEFVAGTKGNGGVRGFGLLGLAVIQAEASISIGEYRTVSGLWKRMGVAVIQGRRQGKRTNKEEALEHGYNPRRRAELWVFCSDSLFRAQARREKEIDGVVIPAHAIGPYGEVYYARRARTAIRIEATADLPPKHPDKWTKARCHNDARRVMSKALLRDLWRVSRGLPPRGSALSEDGMAAPMRRPSPSLEEA